MRGINKVILIGKPVANLRLATNRVVHGQEETQFHSVVCWDRLAEPVAEYVKKGDPLYVEGRLQDRRFQDEEGKARGVAEVVANDVQFLGRRRAEASDATSNLTSTEPEKASSPSISATDEVSPDEIPF